MAKKISIGITGFSRSGKTVYICALAQALLTSDAWVNRRGQGPLAEFSPFEKDVFCCAQIRNDKHTDLPQFPFRKVRDSLCGEHSQWPKATEGISRLVIDIEYKKKSMFFSGNDHIELELIDYPGEWLIDLPMLEMTFEEWSQKMLEIAYRKHRQEFSKEFIGRINKLRADHKFCDDLTGELADVWTEYLHKAFDQGFVLNQPGRLLRPDRMKDSPVLRLAPLPENVKGSELWAGMERRFEDYKAKAIKPFYKNNFSKIDRQIVLVDLLRSLKHGKNVFDEMSDALKDTLSSFNYGKGGFWSWILGNKTTHVLFAATKADHVVKGDRANLEKIMSKLLRYVDDNNILRMGALKCEVMEIASVRASEDRRTVSPPIREILYCNPEGYAKPGAFDPGGLPLEIPPKWEEFNYEFYDLLPLHGLAPESLYEGFSSINLGRSIDFLIGDDFK